jgi:hypothetical protein
MIEFMDRLARKLASWFPRFFRCPPAPEPEARGRCLERLRTCVEHHRPSFEAVGVTDPGEVIEELDAGRLASPGASRARAQRVKGETSVLGDIVLAQSCVEQQDRGAEEFNSRYRDRLEVKARSMAAAFAESFQPWLHFTEPRPRTGKARLDHFDGRTVLWCFLKMCLYHEFCSWTKQQQRERRALLAMSENRKSADQSHSDGGLMGREIAEQLRSRMREQLSDEEWLMIQWKLEGRSQKDIATLLGVSEGHLSRKYDALYRKLRRLFVELGREMDLPCEQLPEKVAQLLAEWGKEQENATTSSKNATDAEVGS